jgi:hypothetical protein
MNPTYSNITYTAECKHLRLVEPGFGTPLTHLNSIIQRLNSII